MEVLEAQRQNAVLTRELASLKSGKGEWDGAAAALDLVLAAVPALQRLRGSLSVPAPRKARQRRISVVPVARVATSAAPLLGSLNEESEIEETPRRNSSKIGGQRSSAPTTPSDGSPFVSPSPKRTTPKRRRRRESGLFPPQFQPTPEPNDAEPSEKQLGLRSAWHEVPTLDEDAVEAAVTPTMRRNDSKPLDLGRVRDMAKQLDAVAKESTRPTQPEKKTPPRHRKSASPAAECELLRLDCQSINVSSSVTDIFTTHAPLRAPLIREPGGPVLPPFHREPGITRFGLCLLRFHLRLLKLTIVLHRQLQLQLAPVSSINLELELKLLLSAKTPRNRILHPSRHLHILPTSLQLSRASRGGQPLPPQPLFGVIQRTLAAHKNA